jgi:hypothetical protein
MTASSGLIAGEDSMFRTLTAILRRPEKLMILDAFAQGLRNVAIKAALAMLASLFALGAIGCGAAAVWVWALRPLGPVGVPLLVAAMFAMACIIAVLAMGRRPRRWRTGAVLAVACNEAMDSVTLLRAAARGFALGLAGEGAVRG